MRGDKYTLLRNSEETDIRDVIEGIHGIADATDNHHESDEIPEGIGHLLSALRALTQTLYDASFCADIHDVSKVQQMLAEPNTEAEELSDRLKQRGLVLLEHTAMPAAYAVLEPRQGVLQMQMNTVDGIEYWLEQNSGGAS